MLTQKQVSDAVVYNSKRVFDRSSLVWPWCKIGGSSFVWATAIFQAENRIVIDGKFGATTESYIRREMDNTSVEVPTKSLKNRGAKTYSNAIVVNGERVRLPDEFLRVGLIASNFMDDGEVHFKHRQRSAALIHFVLHETCGNTANGCTDTLKKKGYGVQLILAPNGHLSCHGDLVRDRMIHANQLNDTSFGMEIVDPYNPIYVIDKAVWYNTIPRKWWTWVPALKTKGGINKAIQRILNRKGLRSVPKKYVVPTAPQMVAARLLVPWLCEITGVPYRFPTKGLNKKKRRIDGLTLKPKGRPGSGVVAHRDFASHSDGRYILESLIGETKGKSNV